MVSPKSSVFLFIGSERYLKERAIAELALSVLGNSSKELDYKAFYGGEATARDVIDYATTLPFLSEKRFVVIRDFGKFPQEDRNRLINYLEKPSKHACLAVDLEDDDILDKHASIKRSVNVVRLDGPDDSKIPIWIKKYLAPAGKEMEPEAIGALRDIYRDDLLSLTMELDKLIAFTGERKKITAGDVEEITGKSIIGSTFDLTRAIGQRDMAKSLGLIYELTSRGKRAHEIIGLVCWQFKRMLRARLLQDRGETNYYIMNALGVNKSVSNHFFRQLNSLDVAKIRSKMDLLLEADLDIKTSRLAPALILEFAIIRLCLD